MMMACVIVELKDVITKNLKGFFKDYIQAFIEPRGAELVLYVQQQQKKIKKTFMQYKNN